MTATTAPHLSPSGAPRRAGAQISPALRAQSLHIPRRGEPIPSAPKGLRWGSRLQLHAAEGREEQPEHGSFLWGVDEDNLLRASGLRDQLCKMCSSLRGCRERWG